MTSPHGLCRIAPVSGPLVDWGAAQTIHLEPLRPPDVRRPHLSPRQRRIYTFICTYTATNGYPPSLREIAEASGLWSASSVVYQLGQLAAKGLVERSAGCRKSRAFRLVTPEGVA